MILTTQGINVVVFSTAQEGINQMFCRQNAILVRQGNSHIMEHHAKCVLLEATVLMGKTNVLSVLQDTSKCDNYNFIHVVNYINFVVTQQRVFLLEFSSVKISSNMK